MGEFRASFLDFQPVPPLHLQLGKEGVLRHFLVMVIVGSDQDYVSFYSGQGSNHFLAIQL